MTPETIKSEAVHLHFSAVNALVGSLDNNYSDSRKAAPHDTRTASMVAGAALRQAIGADDEPRSMAPQLSKGDRHLPEHNELRRNKRGLYRPTRLDDDNWCDWVAA
jgi:hypothetical protein